MIKALLTCLLLASGHAPAAFSAVPDAPMVCPCPAPPPPPICLPRPSLPLHRSTRPEPHKVLCDTLAQDSCQGIGGTVYRISGNRMPAPGVRRGPLRGVPSTVYIFDLTNISQVIRVGQSAYYSAVRTRLVRVEATDSQGHFRVCLPVGRYSIFTRKNGLYYASQFDTDNNIAPAEVVPGKITKVDCHIEGDHPPTY